MTIKFPDLSHYKTGVNVAKYPALITKATEGTTFVDSTYKGYKAAAAKAGIPFAAYHFLDPGDIAGQAAHAYSVISKTPTMLDVERSKGGNASWAETKAFITAYRKLGGVVHLAYIPKWYWSGTWKSPSLGWLTDKGIRVISSNYTTYTDSGPGWAAYGGVKPVIWQYTSTPMDMNAFKGTQAELAALFAGKTLEEDDMPLSADDLKKISDLIDARIAAADIPHQVAHNAEYGKTVNDTNQSLAGVLIDVRNAVTKPTV